MKKVCPVCKSEYDGGEVFCPVDAARLVSASQAEPPPTGGDPLVGAVFDKYKVVRRIGEGGMGLVYESLHTVIEKRVAMKVLRDDFSSRPEVVERFRQEAKSASRIGHEHIVDISDFGTTPTGSSYFVMEFLEGEDLASVLAREHTLSVERTASIVLQCCRALGAAHVKGIVHRDMKPENIFLTKREDQLDFVKIVDFGIAKMSDIETAGAPGRKLTKTGMIFGTPEYMSPEQAAGKELDHRVDVYALGVILFECLTGRVPFVGDTFMGILTQHMFEEVPPLRAVHPHVQCSAELEAVIYKALAKKPEDRFGSMEELGEAIQEAMQGRISKATLQGFGEAVKARPKAPRTVSAAPTAEMPVAGSSAGRNAMLVVVALLLVAGGAAGVFFALKKDAPEVATTDLATPPGVGSVPSPVVDDAGAAAPEEDAGAEVAEASTVPVRVETRPSDGAEIRVEGSDTLRCEPSPCTLELPVGEAVTVHARRGRYSGEIELTPSTPSTVQIMLVARRSRPTMAGTMDEGTSTPASTMMTGGGDLKIPTIFQ
ncbi:MAG: serine/threonine protein kinase [Myxococcales bacterium]|nr:serine/threonine protein kinase [Myxococcales bacterium]